MSTVRKRMRVTTLSGAQGDAVQRNLAQETRVVSPAEEVVFAVETFAHTFDPEAFRAAIAYAKDPLLGGRFNTSTGRSEGGRRASEIAKTSVPTAYDANGGPANATATPASTATSLAQPWYRTLRQAVVNLGADAQVEAVKTCLENAMVVLRALNVSPQAIVPFRALCERKWGYPRENTNEYYSGVPGAVIADFNQAIFYAHTQPVPSPVGDWRIELARRVNIALRGVKLEGWDVVFGRYEDQNLSRIGCRFNGNRSASLPSGCERPTGECHTFWVQADAQIFGGKVYFPSQLGALEGHVFGNVFDGNRWRMESGIRTVGRGDAWDQFFFEIEKYRRKIFATVPPSFYFDLFYEPQPEFGNMTFLDWIGSVPVDEVVRTLRRENSKRLARFASRLGYRVNDLIGRGEAELARRAIQEERERQAQEGIIGAAAGGLAQIGGPVTSLIAGAGTAIAALFKANSDNALSNPANVFVDVFGQLMPAFSQFHIAGGVEEFEHAIANEVRNIPAPSPSFAVTTPVFLPGFSGVQPIQATLFDAMPSTGAARDAALQAANQAVTQGPTPQTAPAPQGQRGQSVPPDDGFPVGKALGAAGALGILGAVAWKRDAIARWLRNRR